MEIRFFHCYLKRDQTSKSNASFECLYRFDEVNEWRIFNIHKNVWRRKEWYHLMSVVDPFIMWVSPFFLDDLILITETTTKINKWSRRFYFSLSNILIISNGFRCVADMLEACELFQTNINLQSFETPQSH